MVLTESDYNKLKHGDSAPEFGLMGTDNEMHSLHDYHGKKGLLVIFMCNHCPYVKAKIDTINSLAKDFAKKRIAVVGISANDVSRYPDDSFESMQAWAEEKGFAFDYLYDETQDVAKSYGAVCTPDPFLFDKDFKLVYHGRIDDGVGPDAPVTTHELRNAIEKVAKGEKLPGKERPSMGCSIKWKNV